VPGSDRIIVEEPDGLTHEFHADGSPVEFTFSPHTAKRRKRQPRRKPCGQRTLQDIFDNVASCQPRDQEDLGLDNDSSERGDYETPPRVVKAVTAVKAAKGGKGGNDDPIDVDAPSSAPRKRRRKGDKFHQEWVRRAFDVREGHDAKGKVNSIVAYCLFCARNGKKVNPKAHKVFSVGSVSASWSGPKLHLRTQHGIDDPDQLEDMLGKPWVREAPGQQVLGPNLGTHFDAWSPRTGEWDKAVDALGKLVSVMNLPFHFGERAAFTKFMTTFIPRWPRISRQTVTRNVGKQSDRIRESIRREMLEVSQTTAVALTADLWSSRASHGHLTTTMHWLDDGWKMKKHILGEWRSLHRVGLQFQCPHCPIKFCNICSPNWPWIQIGHGWMHLEYWRMQLLGKGVSIFVLCSCICARVRHYFLQFELCH